MENNNATKIALVIFIIISLSLGGYIIYEKFNQPMPNEKINEKENDKKPIEDTKKIIDNEKYFRTESIQKKVNGKMVDVDLGFYKQDEETIKYDIIVNNKIYTPSATESINTMLLDPDQMTESKKYIDEIVLLIKNSFGFIKGDKDYLYFKTYGVMPAGEPGVYIFITNDQGTILTSEKLQASGQGITIKEGCNKELYEQNEEDDFRYSYSVKMLFTI